MDSEEDNATAIITDVCVFEGRNYSCCYNRYNNPEAPMVKNFAKILNGPIILFAAFLALVGGHYAIKFLKQAGLNKDLTAALYTLAISDTVLILACIVYHSIEATSLLIFGDNLMWNHQQTVLITYGAVNAATTASTLLVVFITFQRFFVVWWPLKYATLTERSQKPEVPFRRYSNLCNFENTNRGSIRRMLSPAAIFQRGKKNRLLLNKSMLRPYVIPLSIVAYSIVFNIILIYIEFELTTCVSLEHDAFSVHIYPTDLRQSSKMYAAFKTVIRMATETVGPIFTISFITIITEHKVYTSLQARRKLFESQHRRRSVILLEELKEKVSRAVAIFIAIKFIILRSLPVFFDLYELIHGINSFGIVMSFLVRISDFGVILNSATNSLAYFGRKQWLENRLKGRLLRKCFGSSDKNCPSEKLLIQEKRNVKSVGSITRDDVLEGDSV